MYKTSGILVNVETKDDDRFWFFGLWMCYMYIYVVQLNRMNLFKVIMKKYVNTIISFIYESLY